MFSLLLQSVVGLLSLALGVGALAGAGGVRALGLHRRLVRWPWGLVVALGGVGLLVGTRIPFVTFFAAALLALALLGLLPGALVRLARRRRAPGVLPVAGLLVAVLAVGALQPLGLKVLLLPRADTLPYEPVAGARVVKTYGDGMWFEGVEAGPDGTLYLAESTGENYATGDKSNVHAEVIARAPDGSERTFFTLPTGSTAGVMAVAPDGALYLAVTGDERGLWRIGPDGEGRLLAALPDGSFPNGVTLAPDGGVYVADAALGTVWHVDPTTGAVTRAYEGRVLRARRYVALPPGANGIHVFRDHVYVTNSDAGTLLRFTPTADGTLRDPQVVVRGVPADDFAIDDDGTIYLTTHIYDTIVRVDPDGRRTVVADERQHIVGATDCALVRGADGTETLYAVTDGGALASGDAHAAGTLVALDVATR